MKVNAITGGSIQNTKMSDFGSMLEKDKCDRPPVSTMLPNVMKYGVICFVITLAAAFAEEPACASCHPRETANYRPTAMANSISAPGDNGGGRIVHKPSGSTIDIIQLNDTMIHRLSEGGRFAEHPVAYAVGAGIVGKSFLVRIGKYLFQSPASYYTTRKGWDLTPGYEPERHLDFDHEISSGCLFCHTGAVHLIEGSNNRYQEIPFTSISCERCHGPSAAHIAHHSKQNIVNPATLSARARDSVCEQCPLEGAMRILNPGKDWWDFRAGLPLEQVFSVYVAKPVIDLRAVSQVEQLADIACARGGTVWCGTCHDPHGDVVADRKRQVRQICTSCHQQLSQISHPPSLAECTSCHMPSRDANDVAHAAVTDHRILRRPDVSVASVRNPPLHVAAWHEPDVSIRQRNFGLASLAIAEEHRSSTMALESVRLLTTTLPQPISGDPEVLEALGSVLLQQCRPADARGLFSAALAKDSNNAVLALDLGIACEEAADQGCAIRNLNRAILLDPSLRRAYFELAKVYGTGRQSVARRQVLQRYLKPFPDSIAAQLLLAAD